MPSPYESFELNTGKFMDDQLFDEVDETDAKAELQRILAQKELETSFMGRLNGLKVKVVENLKEASEGQSWAVATVIALSLIGAALLVTGVVLSATGVGAAIGVPLAVVGVTAGTIGVSSAIGMWSAQTIHESVKDL